MAASRRNKLYKTELCKSWKEEGCCLYGSRCLFAHGQGELRPHPRYKTELCHSWSTVGTCPYGDRCTFAHGPDELRPTPAPVPRASEVCRFFAAGSICSFGSSCQFSHDMPPESTGELGAAMASRALNSVHAGARMRPDELNHKTQLCRNFTQGIECPYGTRCAFAHGEHELRSRPAPRAAQSGAQATRGGTGRRPLFKTMLCNSYMSSGSGTCVYGDRCQFAHSTAELRPNPLHKTELCLHHSSGNCAYGEQCHFAHGKEELRPRPVGVHSAAATSTQQESGSPGGARSIDSAAAERTPGPSTVMSEGPREDHDVPRVGAGTLQEASVLGPGFTVVSTNSSRHNATPAAGGGTRRQEAAPASVASELVTRLQNITLTNAADKPADAVPDS